MCQNRRCPQIDTSQRIHESFEKVENQPEKMIFFFFLRKAFIQLSVLQGGGGVEEEEGAEERLQDDLRRQDYHLREGWRRRPE